MRSFAEEKKQKTDQLLLSLPIKSSGIVLAKYLSMITVLLIPTLLLCLVPFIMSFYGTVNFISAFSALFAFYLLGCALTAVGMLISSLTENQIISAILTFFVTLIAYFMSSVSAMLPATAEGSLISFIALALLLSVIMYLLTKKISLAAGVWILAIIILLAIYILSPKLLEGSFQQAMTSLSLFDSFYGFVNGVFDLTGLVYYISVSILFCYYTTVIFEKRRWS
jgi:ABC-2 type transport system permease protein